MQKITTLVFCSALILVSGDSNLGTVSASTPSTTSSTHSTTVTPVSTTKNVPTTTSTPTTTASTTVPTTTPVTPSTTTPKPIPPDPTAHKWVVNGTDKKGAEYTCIVMNMAVQLSVMYNTTDKKENTALINVPVSAVASGKCESDDESITLSWNATKTNNSLTFHFARNETSKHYSIHHIEVDVSPDELPGSGLNSTQKFVHMKDKYSVEIGKSYRCVRLQNFNLTRETNDKTKNDTVGHIKITELHLEAFKTDPSMAFNAAQDCAFDTPDIVPIVVGCVLAGLVLIVLISYLISRRRSQARGYLSM